MKMDYRELYGKARDTVKNMAYTFYYSRREHKIMTVMLVIVILVALFWLLKWMANLLAAMAKTVGILLLIALFIWGEHILAFFRDFRQPDSAAGHTMANPMVAESVARFVFGVLQGAGDVLGEYCIMPTDFYETFTPGNWLDLYFGTPVLKLHLLRKPNKDISGVDLGYIKVALQQRIKARLAAGYLTGLPWAAPVCMSTPLVKVVNVDRSDMYLHLGFLLVNDAVSLNAARMSDRPVVLPNPDASDDLF